MSTLSVTTVTTASGTTNLTLNTGNTSGPDIVLIATNTIQMGGNSSTNTFQISANGHSVFANTTVNTFVLTSAGQLDIGGSIRATKQALPSSGAGTELSYTGGVGYITSYDRTASVYNPLQVLANSIYLVANGTTAVTIATTGTVTIASNTLTLGTSQTQANNGYTRLPNGMLMQWGNVLANTTTGNVTFPTPFATIYQSQVTSGLTGFYGFIAGSNTTVIQCRSSQAVAATNLVSWYAIGA
jgi:hypothetical protein